MFQHRLPAIVLETHVLKRQRSFHPRQHHGGRLFLHFGERVKDLEDAIMRELEQFLLELGSGFSFLARQKRIIVDEEDFHMDLLFFNRDLKRLVVIELKLDDH